MATNYKEMFDAFVMIYRRSPIHGDEFSKFCEKMKKKNSIATNSKVISGIERNFLEEEIQEMEIENDYDNYLGI